MFPLLPDPSWSGERTPLSERALALERSAAALGGLLPEATARAIADHLRIANAYYSNRIEGHDTRPGAIERALREDLSEDSALRNLQREARAHVEVERLSEARFPAGGSESPFSADGLAWIHREFYERVPADFRYVEDPETGRREPVEPGGFRKFDVTVGRHVPPEPSEIPRFIARALDAYDPRRLYGLDKVIAFAASHHRLLWIHPFGDGNGRVVRLASTAYARAIGLGGMGLWSPSRGLARRRDDYMAALANADASRLSDTDGRGERSARRLAEFVEFFLDVCFDQVEYMRSVLELEKFGDRLVAYAALPDAGIAPGPGGRSMRKEAGPMLRSVALRGEIGRGELVSFAPAGNRIARGILADLLEEGFLASDSPRGSVRLAMPTHAVPYLLPGMYPEGVAVADTR